MLEGLVPSTAKTALIEESFQQAWDRKNGSVQANRERLETQGQALQKAKNRLLFLVQKNAISEEDFTEQYERVTSQLTEVKAALSGVSDSLDCDTCCPYLEHLPHNLHLF